MEDAAGDEVEQERGVDVVAELDIGRSSSRHLSFGLGLHHCLGAPLARMEGAVAIGALVARAPRLRLRVPVSRLRWRPGFVLRGLEALPVSF